MLRIVLPLFLCFWSVVLQSSEIHSEFKQFQYTNQLPSNSVQCMIKDSEGYIWFGTRDGLCRFDGYRIKVFRSDVINHKKLTNNNIRCMLEDNKHRLWIGTNEGINILDKSNYAVKPFDMNVIGRDRIVDMRLDKKGNIWISTSSKGIFRVGADGRCVAYSAIRSNKMISSNVASSIYQDSRGNIWALFWKGGVAMYNPQHDKFIFYPPIGVQNSPFKMLEDKDHNYWICTWGDGLFAFDPKDSKHPYTPVLFRKNGKPVEMNNVIYRIIQDSGSGHLWIISFAGLDVLKIVNRTAVDVITGESMFKESSNKLFHEILDDKNGCIWLGAVSEGIYQLNLNHNEIYTNSFDALTKKMGYPPNVYHVCEIDGNKLYVVIDRLGVYELNIKSGALAKIPLPFCSEKENVHLIHYFKSNNSAWFIKERDNKIYIVRNQRAISLKDVQVLNIDPNNHSSINCLYEDAFSNVWIGFDQGLYKRSRDGKITLISDKILNIMSLSGDCKGNIWVGTERQGAFHIRVDESRRSLVRIDNFSEKAGNLQSNSIQAVCCSQTAHVYLGSREGSIYQYTQSTGETVDISYKYGITEDAIQDIIEDNYGLLWISTTKKNIRYNPLNHVSMYYTSDDDIQVSSFSKSVGTKLQNGQVLFGGNKGFCLFTPVPPNQYVPSIKKVKITDIDINDRSIFDIEDDYRSDLKNERIILKPNDENLSLEFSSLDYSAADKIQYAYRLIGVDKDWVYPGSNRRYVNYTNLPSGKYVFEVKATDENGQWSNQVSTLTIIKRPPFYLTWWAYLLYLIFLSGIAWFIINRIRLRNELKISRIEKEKSEELAQTKLRYFTNISHDLLTPLTIITLLTDEIEKKLTASDRSKAEMVKSNANRLKRLIHQILAFRKVETGNLKLKVQQSDVVTFVRELSYSNFQPLIAENNINFSINSEYGNYNAWFDKDKLDKILYNLLSNAFKFTPPGGTIIVGLEFSSKEGIAYLLLSVRDTGIGISSEDLPHIFSRFFISNASDQSKSNGIGLSLVKELVEIHNGEVSVVSELDNGTTFTLYIPIAKEAYLPEELFQEVGAVNDNVGYGLESESGYGDKLPQMVFGEHPDFSILVVEDNKELNHIIVAHFSSFYKVFSANNGMEALHVIEENRVDLVISDVMMPEMNGVDLCKVIKGDVQTSHIAVLLLTAKTSTDDQIDYFNAGADAYMSKPFDLKVCEARVLNLIRRKHQSISYFKENRDIEVSSMNYGSLDEEFLRRAIEAVESNMGDVNFDFGKFAAVMNCSRSTLHRKLKALTDLAPGEFIRSIRLKHACQMLLSTTNPISEIAYVLGFDDPKYFSRSFKAELKMSPTEYREMNQHML